MAYYCHGGTERRKGKEKINCRVILVRLPGAAPQLLESLKNLEILAPKQAVMSCRIKPGEPSDEVRWYRSGRLSKLFREIVNDEKYELRRDCDTLSLIIAVTDAPNDSAIYRCEAANKFGKVRTEARLHVIRMSHCLSVVLRTYRQQLH